MNWDRGLKRITWVLSIVAGIVGASMLSWDAARVIEHNERLLANERRYEFSEFAGSLLVDEWKQAKTFADQDWLWLTWTGKRLPREPWWQDEKELRPKEPKGLIKWDILSRPSAEELPRLKEQGWITAKGEPLPMTPEGVWHVKHQSSINDLEATLSSDKGWLPIAIILGGFFSFAGVWVVFGVIVGLVCPVCGWITRGFQEDKQKDIKKRNESDPAELREEKR